MMINANQLATLRPAVSGAVMQRADGTVCQGHLGYISALERWVSWIEHTSADDHTTRQLTSPSGTDRYHAQRQLNNELHELQHRGERRYRPTGVHTGEISDFDARDAERLMNAAAQLQRKA